MAINAWWADQANERYWMEITDRDDVGQNIRAPQTNAAGREEWSYSLVTYTMPGDIVFHWHKNRAGEPALIGWSEVIGPLSVGSMDWLAHGSRGRARGKAEHVANWIMELGGLHELPQPLTASAISTRSDEVLAGFDRLRQRHGEPLYAPFYRYGQERRLRAMQSYLTKLPAETVAVLSTIGDLGIDHPPASPPSIALGTAPKRTTQGRQADPRLRAAIERHAVEAARQHYTSLGATRIVELGKPYDLQVTINRAERHVEVKGATADKIISVQLTAGEVDHANHWPATDLFVLDSISYNQQTDGNYTTHGGTARVWADWHPRVEDLLPTQYRYQLPT